MVICVAIDATAGFLHSSLQSASAAPLPWALTLITASILFYYIFLFPTSSNWRLPPGPPKWPLLGNLPQLAAGPLPHRTLANLAKKYGPCMSMQLGSTLSIIVSSPEGAREVLRDLDAVCGSRPVPLPKSLEIVSSGGRNIGMAPLGDHFKLVRRLCSVNLFTRRRLDQWQPVRVEEVMRACKDLEERCGEGKAPVDMRLILKKTTMNNIVRMCYGRRLEFKKGPDEPDCEGDVFSHKQDVTMELLGAANPADFLPFLRLFDGGGKQYRELTAFFHSFIEREISEHRKRLAGSSDAQKAIDSDLPQDFCDALLTADDPDRIGEPEMVSTLFEMFMAGSDTVAGVSEWALLELVRHPAAMQKLQAELDAALGPPSSPTFSCPDAKKLESTLLELPYLRAVIKETFRHHVIGPLLIPHQSVAPVTLADGKYTVPAGTWFQVNVWAIMHDPSVFASPEEFRPERFLEEDMDFKGTDFRLLPFSSGRRQCPGMGLAFSLLTLILGSIVHRFNLAAAPGNPPADVEVFGLTAPPAKPLHVVPSLR
eukprot:TRINITY_DN20382_c0_g2_i1.p1 TRINITY_DN20382_c0_g2~~TRINITY_DN20382_c0_g2_i1.p1  ORF type:complete len:540 (-),score=71.45 TRINITY_DN20382_c0_g2_i1:2262-3881(-)